MDLAHAISEDDLLLAQLTASKLGKVMHGIMSVGVASLEMPSPTDFLSGKDKVLLGFLEVLRTIGLKPGHTDKIEMLRQQVNQLSDLTRRFHNRFLEIARWRTMSSEDIQATVDHLSECYSQLCQSLGAFCSLFGKRSDYSEQARQGIAMLDAFFQTVPAK
jgi:hypothetical protein